MYVIHWFNHCRQERKEEEPSGAQKYSRMSYIDIQVCDFDLYLLY